ncbi:hypothetical protein CC78DRAFT_621227 [Lojkania enalia]|uniref:Uncharacterized protein n=1 Tax=Lojkania enalia TaxID=147567 RepID=A0A9P4JXY8_9PLEO|nr:hypothetical protein CC78DRAFT_621227 [Didymosphaeria enalia]
MFLHSWKRGAHHLGLTIGVGQRSSAALMWQTTPLELCSVIAAVAVLFYGGGGECLGSLEGLLNSHEKDGEKSGALWTVCQPDPRHGQVIMPGSGFGAMGTPGMHTAKLSIEDLAQPDAPLPRQDVAGPDRIIAATVWIQQTTTRGLEILEKTNPLSSLPTRLMGSI